MHTEPSALDIPATVIDEAISWAVKLDFNAPSAKTRQAFDAWLKAAPVHGHAWQRVQSLKSEFAGIPPALALKALETADARRKGLKLSRRQALKVLSLAGVTGLGVWLAHSHTPWQRLLADASTQVGEQRSLTLEDGTVLMLNTDTAVSIAFDDARRLVVLRRGEILVTTGPDAASTSKRSFRVHTPFGTLQALGTRFVVRLDGERARISVQEGAVRMQPAGHGDAAIANAGEAWWLADDGAAPTAAQGFDADGWADGVIAGKNMRLADLLAELSRYRSGRIVCDDRVAGLRVSGVYHVRDTDRALRFLGETQPVRIGYRTRFWVTVGPT